MMQAIVVKGTTAVRATVIANRTKSDEMGGNESSNDREFEIKTSKWHCSLHFHQEKWRVKRMLGYNAKESCKS